MLGEGREESILKYNLEFCKRLFGMSLEDVKKSTEATNEMYGKRRIPDKCAIFVSEGEDLIQEIEITQQSEVGKCNQVVKSEGGSFNSDATEIEEDNGKGVKNVKIRVGRLIDSWLKTGDCCAPVSKRILKQEQRIVDIFDRTRYV